MKYFLSKNIFGNKSIYDIFQMSIIAFYTASATAKSKMSHEITKLTNK